MTCGLRTLGRGWAFPVNPISANTTPFLSGATFHYTLDIGTQLEIFAAGSLSFNGGLTSSLVVSDFNFVDRHKPGIIRVWRWIRGANLPPVCFDPVLQLRAIVAAPCYDMRPWLRK